MNNFFLLWLIFAKVAFFRFFLWQEVFSASIETFNGETSFEIYVHMFWKWELKLFARNFFEVFCGSRLNSLLYNVSVWKTWKTLIHYFCNSPIYMMRRKSERTWIVYGTFCCFIHILWKIKLELFSFMKGLKLYSWRTFQKTCWIQRVYM